jgi:Resolvase, N terminal domain/Protein of unknown function (DUF3489)
VASVSADLIMPASDTGPTRRGGAVARCAVYTRKSSDDGLEQDFNSLHAQREACEAYIKSQRHEGWVVSPEEYDDGGISGATMERPALQRLLADIRARKIDTIVVYKVDRLTRSLADFAKLVEIFDAHTTLQTLTEATGWQPHTIRAAITGVRKQGYVVRRQRGDDGISVYRITELHLELEI